MLDLLDQALESHLRTAVPLGKDVAVSFEAPDSEWAAKVSGRPAVNLYLWDVRLNLDERDCGESLVPGQDGRRVRRKPLPRIDCRYLVTSFTNEVRDEHDLLGRVLAALLRDGEIGEAHLPGRLGSLRPLPSVQIMAGDGRDNGDFWSALGGQLKVGLDLLVTATVDTREQPVPAGPDVERWLLRTHDGAAGSVLEEVPFPKEGTPINPTSNRD
jgi:hypothetical protein